MQDHKLERAVWAAVADVQAGATDAALDRLARHGARVVGVAAAVLTRTLDAAAQRGWSRDDLRHVVTRRLSARHASLQPLGERPLLDGATMADALRLLVATLALVTRLPDLPVDTTAADPDVPGGLDQRVLRRVRALLNKAESTDFPEEAEALTAKAQELISRHAIDTLVVGEAPGDRVRPMSRRVYLDDPYVDAKSALLASVARANRCSAVFTPAMGWSTLFGFAGDLAAVELLFESLLAQAAHALALEGSRVDAWGRSRTRSFRRSFLVGFAYRIGRRLAEATQEQVEQAGATDAAVLPVLAARDEQVQALQAQTFPRLQQRSTSVSNAAGWAAGQAAAEVADLAVGKERVGGGPS